MEGWTGEDVCDVLGVSSAYQRVLLDRARYGRRQSIVAFVRLQHVTNSDSLSQHTFAVACVHDGWGALGDYPLKSASEAPNRRYRTNDRLTTALHSDS
jgi:hypothetical protein